MKLDRESRIVQWAYLGSDIPRRTSLCAVFWRTVLWSPLKIVAPLLFITALVAVLWQEWPQSGVILGTVVGVLGLLIGLAAGADYLQAPLETAEPSVIRDGFRAVKSKVCPIVDIEDGNCRTSSGQS